MGICSSNPDSEESKRARAEQVKTRQLDQQVRQAKKRGEHIHKLLLLGAGESGKSTLFKQMVMIYGTPDEREMTDKTREGYVEFVFSNVVANAQALSQASLIHGPPETPEGKTAVEFCINSLSEDSTLGGEVVEHLISLWGDPGILKCYENRARFQLNDSAEYFFDKLAEISAKDYIPSVEDILRVRIRTTGIVEHPFTIEGVKFRMFDVGGQRNERKKWIHCFEDVQAVLFVAAISEFDQVLYEEINTNRMTEALNLFKEVSNSEYFNKCAVILFLNKIDLFVEKIKVKNITDSACEELKEFRGNCRSVEETSDFLQDLFLGQYIPLGNGTPKQLFCHITCATDTSNVQHVFNDVKQVIINIALGEGGLLDY